MRIAIVLCLFCSLGNSLSAEELRIPISEQGKAEIKRPDKGMLKADVEREFGTPISRTGPVGEPPISTWRYEKFVVYFEHEHVVHSVLIHVPNPATIDTSPANPHH